MATNNAIDTSYPIEVAAGGSGLATITDHSVLIGSGTGAITPIVVGTNGQVLLGSSAADPVFATLTSTGSTIAFTAGAGTLNLETAATIAGSFPTDSGTATPAAGALTVTGGTNINTVGAAAAVTVNLDAALDGTTSHIFANGGNIGTAVSAGNTLTIDAYDVDGTAYVPFITLTANDTPTCDLSTDVTIGSAYIYRAGGTDVSVADGGTGASTLTDHGLLLGAGVGAVTALAEATDGQLPIGSTGNNPVLATLTAGTGITIGNAAGAITITNTATSGIPWTEITAATKAMVVNEGYTTNNAAQIVYTLPATAAVGSILAVAGNSANGWSIAQNASQTIHFISSSTTTGVGGSLTSTNRYDCVEMVCVTEDADFVVRSATGNLTIV